MVFFLPLDVLASSGDIWVDLGSPRFLATGAFRGLGAALGLFLMPLTSAGDNPAALNSSEHFYTINDALLQFEKLNKSFALSIYSKASR